MYFYRVKNVALSQDLFERGVQYGKLAMLIMIMVLLLMRTPASGLDLTLAWDANVEDDLAGYKLYYGYHSGEYGEPIDVGNVTQYELTGLSDDTIYYFAVTAYDTDTNESDYSREVRYPPYQLNISSGTLSIGGPSSDEVIINGDMELDSGWESNAATNVRSSEQAHTGTYSRKIIANVGKSVFGNNWTSVVGSRYEGDFWIYPVDKTQINVRIQNGDQSGTSYYQTHTGLAQNEWNHIEFEYTETASGTGALFILFTFEAGTFYFDDVSIKGVPSKIYIR